MTPARSVVLVVVLLAAAASTALAQHGEAGAPVRVRDAWARPSVPGASVSAAYAVVENAGASPVAITGLSCDAAASAALHESFEENGMMRMRPVPSLSVPARGRVELRPGGFHVMLMGLTRGLAPGDGVRCELRSGHAVIARFEAEVRAP